MQHSGILKATGFDETGWVNVYWLIL